jgi:hypothetical protein
MVFSKKLCGSANVGRPTKTQSTTMQSTMQRRFTLCVCGSTYVVVVPSENANDSPCLPVPDPNGLVVRAAEDPRVLVVEHRCADVVEVAKQGEQAPPLLVVPQLRRSGSGRVRM